MVGPEQFRFPRMWEGPGIHLRVAQTFLEFGVVKGTVDGGVDLFLGWGGGWTGQWEGMRGGMGLRGRAYWLGRGGGLTPRREAGWGGLWGRGVRGEGCGASDGG